MAKGSGLKKWLGLVVAVAALAVAGCGDDDDDTATVNECGGESQVLAFDGAPAEKGDSCGECGFGELVCDGPNTLTCEDPEPTNECGGCEELPGEVGESCSTAQVSSGVWACEGTSMICEDGEVNACGGTDNLADEPGTACGECGIDTVVCDGANAVMCDDELGCPQAQDVSATQGTRSDGVRVTWRGNPYVDGYRVYRDGEEIADVDGGRLSYLDEDTEAAGAPAIADVMASDDDTQGIEVSWSSEPVEGEFATYEVVAYYPGGEADISNSADGFRGAEVDTYEISTDGGTNWEAVGDEMSYFDEDAPMATADVPAPEIDDVTWDGLTVIVVEAPEPVPAEEQTYWVRAVTDGGDTSEPESATGQRAWGDLEHDFSRSDDGDDFETFGDCEGALECVDEDYEADSDVEGRYYRIDTFGEGFAMTSSDPVWGEVEKLVLSAIPVADEVEVGDSLEFTVVVETSAGEEVAREGAELMMSISDEDVLQDPVPEDVMTDDQGSATVELTFEEEGEDVVVSWTADDSRVSDETVEHNSFTVFEEGVLPIDPPLGE